MGILLEDINRTQFFYEKTVKTNLNKLNTIHYEQIYNDYKNRFFNEFCVLIIDNQYCYGHVNTNNYNLTIMDMEYLKYSNAMYHRYCVYFKSNYLYKKIPLLLENNISVILVNSNYDVTAIHHPQNKYHSNSFSFVYFPF